MSRSTRASIASSLLALSLLAAGCGGAYTRGEVRRAFDADDVHLIQYGEGDGSEAVRPLASLFAFLDAAASGTISFSGPNGVPVPAAVLGVTDADDIVILVYSSARRAQRAEDALGWFARHAEAIQAEMERRLPDADDDEARFDRFEVARENNVVVTYPPAAERRVRAALDRLG